MMHRTGLFKYVPHTQADEHMKAGWMFVRDLGPTHGTYSALFWRCDCFEKTNEPIGTSEGRR
jgi:hypothetical protein